MYGEEALGENKGWNLKMNAWFRLFTCRSKVVRGLQAALALFTLGAGAIVNAQSTWATTRTHAHPVTNAEFRAFLSTDEQVDIVVALKLRNRDQLDALVDSFTNPADPRFRKWLTREQALAAFAPTQEQVSRVVRHLSNAGFSKISVSSNQLLVSATGTADVIRRSFNTELAHFRRDGRDSIANTQDVSVPVELSDVVESVLGLQTMDVFQTMVVTTHNPTQFPAIYNAIGLPAAVSTVVGIITEGSMTQTVSDLHNFETANSLPTINPTIVNVGGASTDTSGTVEWDLDSQDIQGMAGGQLGGMIFYTSVSLTNSALTATFNRAVSDNAAKIINVSLGECETTSHSDGSMSADDAIFAMAVVQGQTFSVASGDLGSRQCGTGGVNGVSYGSVVGVSYPASSPYVIAVGGTTLSTTTAGTYSGETGWGFSGGGPSLYEAQPTWQAGVVSGTKRGVPDIAFDADPNSGAAFIANGASTTNGGTSLASPLFVGAFARIESAHHNAVGFPGRLFYSYGAHPPSTLFNDVTSGSNDDFTAGPGWDFVTGFGSLNVTGFNTAVTASTAWLQAVLLLLR
jgi:pseudomonalisin